MSKRSRRMIYLPVNDKGAVSLFESVKLLEEENDDNLALVRRTYPYKIPQDYLQWRYLSAAISLSLTGIEIGAAQKQDQASFLHSHKCSLWYVKNQPIYCLENDLLESILHTDINDNAAVLKDLTPSIPGFILLFPRNKILTPDNTSLDFCVVHLSEIGKESNSFGEKNGIKVPYISHEHPVNLHWSAMDNWGTIWFSGAGLKKDGTIEFSHDSVGSAPMTLADKVFLNAMRSLVLQIYLILQYKPEALSDVTFYETIPTTKKKGFSQPNEPSKVLYPRWIKRENKLRRPRPTSHSTHASPITHWRRGHWKRVLIGKGRLQEKWVWIEATLINA